MILAEVDTTRNRISLGRIWEWRPFGNAVFEVS
ncbi:MAG: hypothetical protein RI953_1009, partial [Pseudomonadota bacterium]